MHPQVKILWHYQQQDIFPLLFFAGIEQKVNFIKDVSLPRELLPKMHQDIS